MKNNGKPQLPNREETKWMIAKKPKKKREKNEK